MRAVTRIIKSILLVGIAGLGALLVINVWRGRLIFAGVDVFLSLILVSLYYALNRWPQLERPVGLLMALLLIGVPVALVGTEGENMANIMPILAICAVLILCLLWPAVGPAAIGAETLLLLWLAFGAKVLNLYVPAAFATASLMIYLISRSLVETLASMEVARVSLARKNEELEQTLLKLTDAVVQQQSLQGTVRELEMPLIEGERGEGVLIVVGHCDPARLESIREVVFARLRQRPLRRLIVDVSGAVFDEAGLDAFVHTLQAWRLMVQSVVVSGMSPQQATELSKERERVRLLRETIQFVQGLQEAFAG